MYQQQLKGQTNPNYNPLTREYFRSREAQRKPFSQNSPNKQDRQGSIPSTPYKSKPLSAKSSQLSSSKQSRNLTFMNDFQKTINRVKGNLDSLNEQKLILKKIQDFHISPFAQKKPKEKIKRKDDQDSKNPVKILVNKYQDVILDGYQSLSDQMKSIFDKHHDIDETQKKRMPIKKRSQSLQIQKRLRLNQHTQFDSIINQCQELHRSVDYNKRLLVKYSKNKQKKHLYLRNEFDSLQFQNFVEDQTILKEIEKVQNSTSTKNK